MTFHSFCWLPCLLKTQCLVRIVHALPWLFSICCSVLVSSRHHSVPDSFVCPGWHFSECFESVDWCLPPDLLSVNLSHLSVKIHSFFLLLPGRPHCIVLHDLPYKLKCCYLLLALFIFLCNLFGFVFWDSLAYIRPFSCLSFPSAEITGVSHHAYRLFSSFDFFLFPF